MASIDVGHGEAGHGDGGHGVSLAVEWMLVALSVAVAVAGIWLARRFYQGESAFEAPRSLAERFRPAYTLLLNKYWVDEIYDSAIVRPIHRVAVFSWKVIDVVIIDTVFVNGSAFFVELAGDFLRFITTGNVRNYALYVAVGIFILAVVLW